MLTINEFSKMSRSMKIRALMVAYQKGYVYANLLANKYNIHITTAATYLKEMEKLGIIQKKKMPGRLVAYEISKTKRKDIEIYIKFLKKMIIDLVPK